MTYDEDSAAGRRGLKVDLNVGISRRELLARSLGAASIGAFSAAAAQSNADLPDSSRELWQWVRSQPVGDLRIAWLDAASGNATLRSAMAAEYRAREIQSTTLPKRMHDDFWKEESARLAARFAAFAGCDPDEIVFTRGTGEGLSTVAAGLDLASGDEVITTSQEHPASLSPWLFQAKRRGIVVKQIVLPTPLSGPEEALGLMAGAVTERTRVMAFAHVQYADGTLLPVRELCQLARQRDIITVVDGAQAFGMLEFSLHELGCDFYATSFHKWLAGPNGSGMLYVKREMLDRVWPLLPRGIDASPPVPTPTHSLGQDAEPAALHKMGNVVPHLWPALQGAQVAIDFHQQLGRERIEARVRELTIYARLRLQQIAGVQLLTPGKPGLWAGIQTLRLPGRNGAEVAKGLVDGNRVYVGSLNWPYPEDGSIRICLHIFNNHDEVERLLQGLQRFS